MLNPYCFLLQTPQGWTCTFDCSTYAEDTWGAVLPQLKAVLRRWPFLSATDALKIDPQERFVMTRPSEDRYLWRTGGVGWGAHHVYDLNDHTMQMPIHARTSVVLSWLSVWHTLLHRIGPGVEVG